MREARLLRYGSPALKAAFAKGLVGLYRAGEISRLPPQQQKAVLSQWTTRSMRRIRGQEIAAAVIRKALRRSKINLTEIASSIRDAIAG